MTPTHILIGCGARKLDHAAPARDLYIGPLFRAARIYAEASGLPWAILSARYGLVMPEQVIEPYDYRLVHRAYRAWSRHITHHLLGEQIRAWLGAGQPRAQVHAGVAYTRWLAAALDDAHLPVWGGAPLAGLQVGQRLSWYRQRRES